MNAEKLLGETRILYAVTYKVIAVHIDKTIWLREEVDNSCVHTISITGNYRQFTIKEWESLRKITDHPKQNTNL